MTDDQIVQAIREGNRKGYSELMKRYQSVLFYYIYRMVHNTPDAEDLTMVAIEKAYTKIAEYKPEAKFSTWIFIIARNTVIDHIIASNRRITSDLDVVKYRNVLPDKNATPEELLQQKESTQSIECCIDRLPEKRRVLMNLHIDGYKDVEIAQCLKISHIAVRTRLSRIRSELKQYLKELYANIQ